MNSVEESTFFRSALQGGHQSEPLKSIRTNFFSALALTCALERSVDQSPSAAARCQAAQHVSKHRVSFFIFFVPGLRPARPTKFSQASKFIFLCPSFSTLHKGHNGFAF